MKKILVLAVAMLFVAGVAFAANPIANSKHDMRNFVSNYATTQVCVFCHTPHQNAAANSQDPLWNHTETSTAAFGVYASTTLDATPAEIGNQTIGSESVSALCMSCHDGTIAVNSLYKAPKDGNAGTALAIPTTNTAYLGTSLADDHPINFTYDAALFTADGGLVTPANQDFVTAGIPLFGATVQCASCHAVHDNTNLPFLRISNANSALCTACHVK